jgi:translocator protein
MNLLRLVASIALCEAAGVIGGIFTARSVKTWYTELEKPWFSPPSWIFGPVWITLYAMMGVALYLIWQKRTEVPGADLAIGVFMIQLLLNVAWSFFFFGLRSPLFGFIEIVFLWISIAATVVLFWKISTAPGALLVPYLIWVTFASVLTYSIWQLNRGA